MNGVARRLMVGPRMFLAANRTVKEGVLAGKSPQEISRAVAVRMVVESAKLSRKEPEALITALDQRIQRIDRKLEGASVGPSRRAKLERQKDVLARGRDELRQ